MKVHIEQLSKLFKSEGGEGLREWMLEQGLFRGITYAEPGTPEQALKRLMYYLVEEPECIDAFVHDTLDRYIYAVKLGCEDDNPILIIVHGQHLNAKVNVIAISYPPP